MRIKTLLIGLLASSELLLAQIVPGQEINYVTRIVRVKGDAKTLRDLACSSSYANCEASTTLRAIVVKGKESVVAQVEKSIQELDAMSSPAANTLNNRNVELTVYVLGGAMQPFAGTDDAAGETLAPVVRQLRAIFPYSHYQLLSTMMMRSSLNTKADSFGIMGMRTSPEITRPSNYQLSFDSAKIAGDVATEIHLAKFSFRANVPYVWSSPGSPGPQWAQAEVLVQTDVDLRESQKVVVGKANVANSDSCFFLVLSAKLMP
jgi:hypothetical protein